MGNVEPKNFIEIDRKYGRGIAVNEYKGEFSLAESERNGDDIWMLWVYPQKNREPSDKVIPKAIRLGPKDAALSHLRQLIAMIEDDIDF